MNYFFDPTRYRHRSIETLFKDVYKILVHMILVLFNLMLRWRGDFGDFQGAWFPANFCEEINVIEPEQSCGEVSKAFGRIMRVIVDGQETLVTCFRCLLNTDNVTHVFS